jgi:hypothetical protein
MPWAAKLDDEGPRNGDVIVRTAKGRLVAVIYAASTPEETMRRAQALLAAEAPLCSHKSSMSSCGIKVCFDCGAPLNAKARKIAVSA